MDGTLAAADLELLRKDFSANPAYRLAQNAVTQGLGRRRRHQPGDRQQHRPLAVHAAGRLEGHQPGAQRPVLAVRRAQPAARRASMREDGPQGLRVLPELRHVLGQDRARQLLPRGHHRDGGPGHRRPDGRLPPGVGGRRRRPVEHVRRDRGQARPGAEELHAGDAELSQHRPDELGAAHTCCARAPSRFAARSRPAAWRRPAPRRPRSSARSTACCASTSAPRRSASTGSGPTRTSSSTVTAC